MKVNGSLAKQGLFLFGASTVVNISNFLFQFVIGRMLGPAEYSILTALLSLLMIISVPTATIQTVVTKYTSTFKAQENYEKISYLFLRSLKKLSLYAALSFIIFTLISSKIAGFLKISSVTPVITLGSVLAITLITPVGRGVLQGLQNFKHMGINMMIEGILRLILGLLLVLLGLKASGAIAASTISGILAITAVFIPLKFLINKKEKPVDFNSSEMYKYFWPVFITLFCFTILTNIDIIFVKHFFDPHQAGYYAAASLLGKIVLFLPGAFAAVMFSRASELHAQDNETTHVLKKSLLFVGITSLVTSVAYFAFPSLLLSIVFGTKYLPATKLMGLFAIAMSLFSVISILIYYNLSVNNLKFIPLLITSTTLQVILLWFFSHNLIQVLYILIANALFFLILNQILSSKILSLRSSVEGI